MGAKLLPDAPTKPAWDPSTTAFTYNGSTFTLRSLAFPDAVEIAPGKSFRLVMFRSASTDAPHTTTVTVSVRAEGGARAVALQESFQAQPGGIAPPLPEDAIEDDGWNVVTLTVPPEGLPVPAGATLEVAVVTTWEGSLNEPLWRGVTTACGAALHAVKAYEDAGRPHYATASESLADALPPAEADAWREWLSPAIETEVFDHNERHFRPDACTPFHRGLVGPAGVTNRLDSEDHPSRVEVRLRPE